MNPTSFWVGLGNQGPQSGWVRSGWHSGSKFGSKSGCVYIRIFFSDKRILTLEIETYVYDANAKIPYFCKQFPPSNTFLLWISCGNYSIYEVENGLFTKFYALSFCRFKIILDRSNHFYRVTIVLVESNSFWSGPNHYVQVQIIKTRN